MTVPLPNMAFQVAPQKEGPPHRRARRLKGSPAGRPRRVMKNGRPQCGGHVAGVRWAVKGMARIRLGWCIGPAVPSDVPGVGQRLVLLSLRGSVLHLEPCRNREQPPAAPAGRGGRPPAGPVSSTSRKGRQVQVVQPGVGVKKASSAPRNDRSSGPPERPRRRAAPKRPRRCPSSRERKPARPASNAVLVPRPRGSNFRGEWSVTMNPCTTASSWPGRTPGRPRPQGLTSAVQVGFQ